ncbi:beta-1,6-N-acetylglucosaminyltransferase [Limosilactobacillus fermentum]|uniref:beta-1,6-N-acetylglucosaminyltransferase n=1 Tax=Limosilactobacillus fermentum TaxID=1613 RepID=UPI001C006336|nr:beta-1,6-N-acetylglucosaminyltransferase [Limosilactobacillus fermentum]
MSKQAILIQCHKNPEQVNLLLAALQHPDVDIYIHVDKKSDIGSRLRTSSQMHILPDKYRVDVQWATFSQVRATLNLLRYASHHGEYEHYWLCSGQDYPIKSIDEIVRFLHSKPDANFIQIWDSKNSTGGGTENNYDKRTAIYFPAFVLGNSTAKRIAKRALVELTGGWNRSLSIFRRKAPDNVKFYFGSSWICLSGEAECWMESYLKSHHEYIRFYRNVNCPDESFFQTLVMNSPYKDNREDYLHYVDWSEGGNSPKTLTIDDYEKISGSDKLMARKFDLNANKKIIERLKRNND